MFANLLPNVPIRKKKEERKNSLKNYNNYVLFVFPKKARIFQCELEEIEKVSLKGDMCQSFLFLFFLDYVLEYDTLKQEIQ